MQDELELRLKFSETWAHGCGVHLFITISLKAGGICNALKDLFPTVCIFEKGLSDQLVCLFVGL